MTCKQFVDSLSVYYEGYEAPSPAASREALEAHAAGCQNCLNFMRTYEATIRLGADLYERTLPAGIQASIERQILAAIEAETA